MNLSLTQQNASETILDWYKKLINNHENTNLYLTLAGYAGTGKTTIIVYTSHKLKKLYPKLKIAYCAYTGKATLILKSKLIDLGALEHKDNISTIHGLIYTPIEDDNDRIIGWERKDSIEYDLIIVDEASMVDKAIFEDLLNYNIPILFVGDHGQLPPINGSFNLMKKPDIVLEEIFRQKHDNPIIKISMHARQFGKIIPNKYSDFVIKINRTDEDYGNYIESILDKYDDDTTILCGFNNTRVKLNKYIRSRLGFESEIPLSGDKVICLRNNHEKGIYNGMLGIIQSIENHDDNRFYATINMLDTGEIYDGFILKKQFNYNEPINFTENRRWTLDSDLFDFGYAMTVHKAQGGQAKRIIFFEERIPKMDVTTRKKWLYTAVTRAQEELYIIEA